MRALIHTLLAVSLLSFGACRNAERITSTNGDDGAEKVPATGAALLEGQYVNFAWGYQLNGVVIDDGGQISAYEWQRGETPWKQPEGTAIPRAALTEKHSHGRKIIGRVGADTVALIRSLIAGAARGTLSEREARGADMGSTERIAYLYDADTKVYTRISLRAEGDWAWHNTAPEAARLADLLDAVMQRFR